MKNLLTLLLALGFVIGMTSCGGTTSTEEGEAAEEATEQVEGAAAEEMEATEEEATEEEATEEEATEEEATEEEAVEEETE